MMMSVTMAMQVGHRHVPQGGGRVSEEGTLEGEERWEGGSHGNIGEIFPRQREQEVTR